MKLYELVGKDKTQGFSPYVWRSRMALAHKGIEVEMVPLLFTEIPKIQGVTAKTVPILEHEGAFICDSWDIANYLEDKFPDRPSLFGGDAGKAYANFFNFTCYYNLVMPLFQTLVYDIFLGLDEQDRDYFRQSRESLIGKSLEEAHEKQDQNLKIFQNHLWPFNAILKTQEYFCGAEPAYVDYMMYGLFQWAKGVSPLEIITPKDRLYDWRGKMDALFDGLGQVIKTKTASHI